MSNNIFEWVLCYIESLIQPRSGGTRLLILVWKRHGEGTCGGSIKVIGVNYKRRPRQDREERVYLHPNPTANLAGEKREECLFG